MPRQRGERRRNSDLQTAEVGQTVAEVWRTRDQRGREVVLTEAALAHILARHPQMAGPLFEIQSAVGRPDRVTRDPTRHHREIAYRRPSPNHSRLRVVIHYRPVLPQGTWVGDIITAHPTERVDPKEEPLGP